MGVVRRATTGRWAVALGGTVAVGLLPPAAGWLPAAESARSPARLVSLAQQSGSVAHEGFVESTGNLGLPDLPRLGEVAALLGGTTHARVWWESASVWRVDRVTPTGESGTYANYGSLHTWDFESQQSHDVISASPVRLPRVDDLLPPQAARRVLAGVAANDDLRPLPARRVAGRVADGVRVVPAQPESTVGHVDVWVDVATGLPLQVKVFARGAADAALTTRFLDVRMRRPDAHVLRPRIPPGVINHTVVLPDLAAAIDLYAPFALPQRLAGFARSRSVVTLGGSATYGVGLARLVVLPLPPDLGRQALAAATAGGGAPLDVTSGQAVLVSTPLLNVVVARSDPSGRARRAHSYLLAGTVLPDSLGAAADALLSDPPPYR